MAHLESALLWAMLFLGGGGSSSFFVPKWSRLHSMVIMRSEGPNRFSQIPRTAETLSPVIVGRREGLRPLLYASRFFDVIGKMTGAPLRIRLLEAFN